MIEPVLLADSAELTTAAPFGTFRADKMTPPSNRPMLVRDICISIRAAHAVALKWNNPSVHLDIKLEAGRFIITEGFMPAWLLGAVPDKQADYNGVDNTGVNHALSNEAAAGQDVSRLKWILPKPMYLPPNAQLKVSLQKTALFSTFTPATMTVHLSARGLLLDKRQRMSDIPYASAFVPAVGQLQSKQRELCNVLDKALNLHRLIGRFAWQETANSPWTSGGLDDAIGFRGDIGGASPLVAIQRTMGVRLQDSFGVAMTSGPTSEYIPFWALFSSGSNALQMQRVLQPNEHITATLSRAPTSLQRPMISMIGYRQEQVS